MGLVDDGDALGDVVGLVVLLGLGLTEVIRTLDGCSTVLGVGLLVMA